ncbi:hypothetical protein [Marinicella marina]|uniref:hypothetical protein n=2 Tax=Marinicella marina TaxID=2996016 RepID=UPI0024BCF417|nr:hypothetical protein [Marinicella marina]
MLVKNISFIGVIFTAMFMINVVHAQTAFLEQNGLIIIELESLTDIPNGWSEESVFDEISGTSYHRYAGNNQFNNPGVDLFEVLIFIQNPGTYQFRWRNLIAKGDSNTDANDSWLRIIADAYYGQQGNDSIVCPKGYDPNNNDCPINLDADGEVTPEGSGSNGWFKVYRSGSGLWKWSTRTSDNDAHEIFARFDTSGLYLIQISGRSQNHAIDRMVLNDVNYNGDPTDLILPESTTIDADLIFADGFNGEFF